MGCKYIATLISLTDESIKKLIEKRLKEAGLQDLLPAHASVLAILYANNGKLKMSDMARMLSRDKSTITTLVAKMQQNGYLNKTHCFKDKRIFYISLTNKALKIQKTFQETSENLLTLSYKGFSEEEQDTLIYLIEKIKNNFDNELNLN